MPKHEKKTPTKISNCFDGITHLSQYANYFIV